MIAKSGVNTQFKRKENKIFGPILISANLNDVTHYIAIYLYVDSHKYVLFGAILKLNTNLCVVVWVASTFTLMFSSFHRS